MAMEQTAPLEVGMSVADLPVLKRFYTEALGFTVDVEADFPDPVSRMTGLGPGGVSAVWLRSPGGERVKLFCPADPPSDPPSRDPVLGVRGLAYLTFYVSDVDATVQACLAAGGERAVLPGDTPVEVADLRIAFVRDPEGNIIEFVERRGG